MIYLILAAVGMHIGRSWGDHPLEDACPCPKAPCGLVIQSQTLDTCPEHAMKAAKTMRQGHHPEHCPGQEKSL